MIPHPPEVKVKVLADYRAGRVLKQILFEYKVASPTVTRWVKAAGLPQRRPRKA